MNASIFIYPIDLADGGFDDVLREVKALGLDGISLAATYHAGRLLLPHNPVRAVHFLEDGVAYFQVDQARFAGCELTPRVAELASRLDPFAQAHASADRLRLETNAWTVCLHNSRLGRAHPHCAIRNAFGDAYSYGLCPSNPSVRTYLVRLCEDLAERCHPSAIELEAVGFMGYDHNSHHDKLAFRLDLARTFLLSLCFCDHCRSRMESMDLDAEACANACRTELKGYFASGGPPRIDDESDLDDYLDDRLGSGVCARVTEMRTEVVSSLVAELRTRVPHGIPLRCQASPSPYVCGAAAGLPLDRIRDHVDAIILNLFHPDENRIRAEVRSARRAAGDGARLFANLRAHWPDSSSEREFLGKIAVLREEGLEGARFYHYGLIPRSHLQWVAKAMEILQ